MSPDETRTAHNPQRNNPMGAGRGRPATGRPRGVHHAVIGATAGEAPDGGREHRLLIRTGRMRRQHQHRLPGGQQAQAAPRLPGTASVPVRGQVAMPAPAAEVLASREMAEVFPGGPGGPGRRVKEAKVKQS